MKKIHYEIIKIYYDTDERDIYSYYDNKFIDEDKMRATFELERRLNEIYISSLKKAEEIFEKLKNEKFAFEKEIRIEEVTEIYDEDGDLADEKIEIIKKN